MSQAVTTHLDEDIYDKVCEANRTTGKSKSQIVNEWAREGYERGQVSRQESVLPVFGQSLFIVGFVIAFYVTIPTGLGVSAIGAALMYGSSVDHQLKNGADGLLDALRKAAGV